MRVALLANRHLDPENPRSWSGLPYFIRRTLEDAGVDTTIVAAADTGAAGRWARFLAWRLLRRRRYLRACETGLLRRYARQTEKRLKALAVEVVFSPSTWLCAYLRTDRPVVFWTDACFAAMLDFYPSFTRLAPPSVRAGHAAEQAALDVCTRALYSSTWAAGAARTHYRVEPEKVDVVPFGGNLPQPPALDAVAADIAGRDMSRCELLLVGVDWKRKGADIAVDTAAALRAQGVDARLTIVGCRPPWWVRLPAGVACVPFIGKDTAAGRGRLEGYFRRSHFFIMPTRAEAYGLVFSEANAFGVPCLATAVGGLSDVIAEGVNGQLFPLSAGGAEYARCIRQWLRDPAAYRALALRSAVEARARLSWQPAGRRIAEILEAVAAAGTGCR